MPGSTAPSGSGNSATLYLFVRTHTASAAAAGTWGNGVLISENCRRRNEPVGPVSETIEWRTDKTTE